MTLLSHPGPAIDPHQDPHLWLENINDNKAITWAKTRSQTTAAKYQGPGFDQIYNQTLDILENGDKITFVTIYGNYAYNFWQDTTNPRGLWRRSPLQPYLNNQPEWEILLDIDKLGADENQSWVFHGAAPVWPDYDRALISLSPGGSDAEIVREFDIPTKNFIPDGFTLPLAKSSISWINRDEVYVATNFGPDTNGADTITESGYPRVVKRWRRGTPLAEATTVYAGQREDISVSASFDHTPGYERHFVRRAVDFYRSEIFLADDHGELIKIDTPDTADIELYKNYLLILVKEDWTVAHKTYGAGSLILFDFPSFLQGERHGTVLFAPDAHTSLHQWVWTKTKLVLVTLKDVATSVTVLDPDNDWKPAQIPGLPALSTIEVHQTQPLDNDDISLVASSFLTPTSYLYGDVTTGVHPIQTAPSYFDTHGIEVSQHFVTSDDGTKIPYFQIGKPSDQPVRTLLYGYGGFEHSLTPYYSGPIGKAWLEHGNTYILANIRGGGEYGPTWHTSALQENHEKCFQDFSSIAHDLVARGITTREKLAAMGGSNGGLLMGTMYTQFPQQFGAIVCLVPLLDMYRYSHLLAGASWIAEYGDPDKPEEWKYLSRYSPYHNIVSEQDNPALLLYTSTKDDRVHPGHARKFAARLEEYNYQFDYYENFEGGHGAAADNKQQAFRQALIYQFISDALAPN